MEEKRKHERVPVYFKTADMSVLEPPYNKGYVKDISESGMKMKVTQRIEPSTTILLTFSLPDESFEFKDIGARVQWIEGGEIGVEFVDLRDREKEIIKTYVEDHKNLIE